MLLLNTILAQNIDTAALPERLAAPDCAGSITSLGHNLIGDPTGCTITLQPSDLTGDPGSAPSRITAGRATGISPCCRRARR